MTTIDHALYFTFNGPVEGRQPQAMEAFHLTRNYWNEKKQSGEIAGFETVMLASTGNASRPAGFMLITGERSKLQSLRWNDEKFLDLHTQLMLTFENYSCIDGYAGEGFDQHMDRLKKYMKK